MDAIDMLLTRGSARRLEAPAPDAEALGTMLRAGAAAPDHGRLRPWRFIVMAGAARARLADRLDALHRRARPDATDDALRRERDKAFRAPLIIAVAARIDKASKIPEIEQLVGAAAAAQNIMLAAHALGFGAMWKTGAAAYDAQVKTVLELEPDDHLIGFLYIGTRPPGDHSLPRAGIESCVTHLTAPLETARA